MREIRSTAIIGMGALGLLYGRSIFDYDPQAVTYVMDEQRVAKNRGKIWRINGSPYCLPVCSSREATPADLVIVAVKYNELASALDTMEKCVDENTIILSVMNGISSEKIIAERYGAKHVLYTVAQGMDAMRSEGRLDYTQAGELHLGVMDETQNADLDAVCAWFTKTGIAHVMESDIRYRMWCKFMLNVGINQCCMVYETTYSGCLKPGEANDTMIAAMREVITLAKAEGISMGEKELQQYIAILETLSPDGIPSMRQDGVAGRKTEVDMFAGTVIRLAKQHGIPVPANEFLYQRVQEMEKNL